MHHLNKLLFSWLLCAQFLVGASSVFAGNQREEQLSHSVKTLMQKSINDNAPPSLLFSSPNAARLWLSAMSDRLKKYVPDAAYREELLVAVHYEATRAGLDPQLVLGLIQVESRFTKYAISSAGARGYMQVMPFWVDSIGAKDHNLFSMRLNLRYGCTILRHYLEIEHGDYFRALGRYNGSLGKAEYPDLVIRAWKKHWHYQPVFQ